MVRLRVVALVGGLWVAVSTGCAPDPLGGELPARRPLDEELETYQAPTTVKSAKERSRGAPSSPEELPKGKLTRREAVAAALMHNPSFAAASWEVRSREAQTLQAGLPANPVLETEIADFGGTGETSGFDVLETTVAVVQPIELGGDREKRITLAKRKADLAGWEYEAKRLDVITKTRRRFVDALVAQRHKELLRRSRQVTNSAEEDEEDTKARDALANVDRRMNELTTQLSLRETKQNIQERRQSLAAMWGSERVTFDGLAGSLAEATSPPSFQALQRHIESHPKIARLKAKMKQQRAAGELAKAEAVPDIEARVGGVHTRETDDLALEIETALPLPLFDRRQGDRLAARFGRIKTAHRQRAVRLDLKEHLRQVHARTKQAARKAKGLRDRVLPAAKEAVTIAKKQVQQGQSSKGMLIKAKKRVLNVRRKHLDALAEYHRARIELERVIGRKLHVLSRPEREKQ